MAANRRKVVAASGGASASFDFTMSTLSGTTSWTVGTIATVLLTGIDAADFDIEIVESPGVAGDEAGIAVSAG